MISSAALLAEIRTLSPALRKEAEDYISFLKKKMESERSPLKDREFGYGKGKVWISEDFDAPLDDFSEYR
ncbi:type II toxin-antitoxin system VapB family antitoxin [Siphonobacter aquaeclarae]|jgi:hypothetical protein|uniref:DUF2281 domain-containing protein n=1 Tax=Siphonobacter aquaeclarae TaxID=563176 RepID=A0A1G9W903_9BACT|nr:DUF2281 domain-containing protein [Siphonobacter aquaeclarae]SDM80980.1 Protein of unknown function [Siphonobacter aquaeclarae]